ncbi:MAG: hypothetical protein AAFX05_01140 [Planctomycetota bacterium]
MEAIGANAAAGPLPRQSSRVDRLLSRMRAGDREAVGEFVTLYGDRVRRRVRGQLGPAVRRLFDSLDILSTVARRLDGLVRSNRLRADDEGELWSLVFRMATNAVIDKRRVCRRLTGVEGPDAPFADALLRRLRQADEEHDLGGELELDRLLRAVPDETDRRILELWLRDVPHVAIATALDIPAGTVRGRWTRIKQRLGPVIDTALN